MAVAGTAVAGMGAAIAEATTAAVGVGVDLPPVRFSADCSLRPTIMATALTITVEAPTTVDAIEPFALARHTARACAACGFADNDNQRRKNAAALAA
jgi:hypothetical protein